MLEHTRPQTGSAKATHLSSAWGRPCWLRLTPYDAGYSTGVPFAGHLDPDLGRLRVARVVSAIDGGHILNEKTARSPIIGATVRGIGMALLEETVSDPGTGRIANATLADYLVAVNADVPDMDVIFVGEPDRSTPSASRAWARSACSARAVLGFGLTPECQ
jgi:CO/xanthine dehydrogenase Mo-binding subunit